MTSRSAASCRSWASRKRMALANGVIPKCSRCGQPRDTEARYCRDCHAAYMRKWRRWQKRETSRVTHGWVIA